MTPKQAPMSLSGLDDRSRQKPYYSFVCGFCVPFTQFVCLWYVFYIVRLRQDYILYQFICRADEEPSSPYDTYPKTKPRSDELIDLTKKSYEPQDPSALSETPGSSRFNFDPQHINQTSLDSKQTYHFGEKDSRENLKSSTIAPPKPKRDWSSLNHDYTNMSVQSSWM